VGYNSVTDNVDIFIRVAIVASRICEIT